MKSVVSEKGQVTIPKEIRENLGLTPGQVIDFEAREGRLVGKKMTVKDPLEDVVGILKGKVPDVDDYLDEIRGPRPIKKTSRK